MAKEKKKKKRKWLRLLLIVFVLFGIFLMIPTEETDQETAGVMEEEETFLEEGEEEESFDDTFDDTYLMTEGNITALEVNQAVGSYFVPDTSEYYYINNFVSKKGTVIYAHLSEAMEPDYSGETQYCELYWGEELICRIAPTTGAMNEETPEIRLGLPSAGTLSTVLLPEIILQR